MEDLDKDRVLTQQMVELIDSTERLLNGRHNRPQSAANAGPIAMELYPELKALEPYSLRAHRVEELSCEGEKSEKLGRQHKLEKTAYIDSMRDAAASLTRAIELSLVAAPTPPSAEKTWSEGVQAFGVTKTPQPYTGAEPCLQFGSTGVLRTNACHPRDLVHALALGETGSGKTSSFVVPFLKSAIGYECGGLKSSLLVVDPKRDLLPEVHAEAKRLGRESQLLHLGSATDSSQPFRLKLFAGAMAQLSVRDRYAKISELISTTRQTGGDGDRWQAKGDELSIVLLQIDSDIIRRTGWSVLRAVHSILNTGCRPLSQWHALDQLFIWIHSESRLRLVCAFLSVAIELAQPDHATHNPLTRLVSMARDDGFNQWLYESRSARLVSSLAGSPEVSQIIDLDLADDSKVNTVSVVDLLDAGKIIVYQPENTSVHDFCTKALKASFFQACLTREQLLRPVFYIVDEFQRFVTLEGDSCETTFLDRCRAYRVTCVLATQSYASLLTVYKSAATLDCLVNNLPTIAVFRTRDPRAREQLYASFTPPRPGLSHVLDIRPIDRLQTGECYFHSPMGRGRFKTQLHASA
jgi:hypothetical protein